MNGGRMKAKVFVLTMIVAWAFTGGAFAMMGDPGHGGGHMGGGSGHGMVGAGNIIPEMRGNVISYGYLQIINPLTTPEEARAGADVPESGEQHPPDIRTLGIFICLQSRAIGYKRCKSV